MSDISSRTQSSPRRVHPLAVIHDRIYSLGCLARLKLGFGHTVSLAAQEGPERMSSPNPNNFRFHAEFRAQSNSDCKSIS